IIDGSRVTEGDAIIGLASSGLHSNGFSLVRRVLPDLNERPSELAGASVAEALLRPTRLYAKTVQAVLAAGHDVRAMSHVTGGGLPGNLPRVLPDGLGASVRASLPRAPIFDLIEKRGPIDVAEMRRTFNCGIGFVMIVPDVQARALEETLRSIGETPIDMGRV